MKSHLDAQLEVAHSKGRSQNAQKNEQMQTYKRRKRSVEFSGVTQEAKRDKERYLITVWNSGQTQDVS